VSDWFETYGHAEVADGLVTGALPGDADDVAVLAGEGVQCVFNLCEDVEYEDGGRASVEGALASAGIEERRLRLEDYGGLSADALESAVGDVLAWLEDGRRVYLHCRAGWQRSAAVAAGVIALREGVELDVALGLLRRRKPSAQPLGHQLEDLYRWWRARGGGSVRTGA
jgi:atypical dual specificity phosphatase